MPFDELISPIRSASPSLIYMLSESKAVRDTLIDAHQIQAVFSGQGGDHFFQQARTPLIAADFGWHHGLKAELVRIVADTARLTRLPIRSVLSTVVKFGILKRTADPYCQIQPSILMNRDAFRFHEQIRVRHPWLQDLTGVPAGKLLQIFHIVDSQNLYMEPSNTADIVHPLVSQPIIELCLQIPSYVLSYGGIDRALIREAFANEIPAEVASRKIKGSTSSYFTSLLFDNISSVRALLLDGYLASSRILDRGAVQASLTESSLTRNPLLLFPLLNAVRAEVWVQQWQCPDRNGPPQSPRP